MKRAKTSRRGGSSIHVLGDDGGRDPKWDPAAHTTTPGGGGGGGASAAAAAAGGGGGGDQNNKKIVLALQSGLKTELSWAMNTLSMLSFSEKTGLRRDAPLAGIPELLDAILQVVDDWRDICTKSGRARLLGSNSVVTGFGNEYGVQSALHGLSNSGSLLKNEAFTHKSTERSSEWWFFDDGLFNMDEEGHAEKQLCAVAASNIIRNLSFMPDNEMIMAQHRHCSETLFQCLEDHNSEDEELVTNALQTLVNLAPLMNLRIFSSSKPSYIKVTEKRAAHSIMVILGSPIKAWHCASAELLGRLIINPDNEPFLLPFVPKIYKRLVDLLGFLAVDSQAAAVGALYYLIEVNMDCRLKLAGERWAVDRLIKIAKTLKSVPVVCRKAAMILESLVAEPQNRPLLAAHESTFAEIALSEGKYSDIFARILYELTPRPSNEVSMTQMVWGI